VIVLLQIKVEKMLLNLNVRLRI